MTSKDMSRKLSIFSSYSNKFSNLYDEDEVVYSLPKQTFMTGTSFEGDWDKIGFHRQGTYGFVKGAKYDGGFKSGMFDGEGVFTYPDGLSFKATFENDKLLEDSVVLNMPGLENTDLEDYLNENDRRFLQEKVSHEPIIDVDKEFRKLPEGAYDAGYGIYIEKLLILFESRMKDVDDVLKTGTTRIPDANEMNWIKENCRIGGKVKTDFRPKYYKYFNTGRKQDKSLYSISLPSESEESKTIGTSDSENSSDEDYSYYYDDNDKETDKLKSRIRNDLLDDIDEKEFLCTFGKNLNKTFKTEIAENKVTDKTLEQLTVENEIKQQLHQEQAARYEKMLLNETEEKRVASFVQSFRDRGYMENHFSDAQYICDINKGKLKTLLSLMDTPCKQTESKLENIITNSKKSKKGVPFLSWYDIMGNLIPTKELAKKYETVAQPNDNEIRTIQNAENHDDTRYFN